MSVGSFPTGDRGTYSQWPLVLSAYCLLILHYKIGLPIIWPCCTCCVSVPNSIHPSVKTSLQFTHILYSLEAFVYVIDINWKGRKNLFAALHIILNQHYLIPPGIFFFHSATSPHKEGQSFTDSPCPFLLDFLLNPRPTSCTIIEVKLIYNINF